MPQRLGDELAKGKVFENFEYKSNRLTVKMVLLVGLEE